MVEEYLRFAFAAGRECAVALVAGRDEERVLPDDAGKHSVCPGSQRRGFKLRAAVCARPGAKAGGKVRGNVREPLHGGLWGAGPGGRSEIAGSGIRGRADFEESNR